MKQYALITYYDCKEDGPVKFTFKRMTSVDLPPNGKWLTREQVEKWYRAHDYGSLSVGSGLMEHMLDELFGEEENK